MRDKYANELSKLQEGQTYRKRIEQEEPSFVPYISQRSENIIKRVRSTSAIKKDEKITDQLMARGNRIKERRLKEE